MIFPYDSVYDQESYEAIKTRARAFVKQQIADFNADSINLRSAMMCVVFEYLAHESVAERDPNAQKWAFEDAKFATSAFFCAALHYLAQCTGSMVKYDHEDCDYLAQALLDAVLTLDVLKGEADNLKLEISVVDHCGYELIARKLLRACDDNPGNVAMMMDREGLAAMIAALRGTGEHAEKQAKVLTALLKLESATFGT